MIERRCAVICDICGDAVLAVLRKDGWYIPPEGWVKGTKVNNDICLCPQCASKLDLIRGEKGGGEWWMEG